MVALTLGLCACAGCGKSDPPAAESSGTPAQPSTLNPQPSSALRLHWLGKKQLAGEPNATNFMAIWNLPESARLEAQTLDKLATAPWRFWQTNIAVSNAPTSLLRPLLDDLVQEESYLEVRTATNQPTELVLAIRLPADQAALWQTNLPLVLRSVFGLPAETNSAASAGFRYQLSTLNSQLSLARSGAWTLLSITGLRPSTFDPRPSDLLSAFQQRLATNPTPYASRGTNYWLETFLDTQWLKQAVGLGGSIATNLPQLSLRLVGDGQNVRTSGELIFPTPLNFTLNPWRIPTNLIHDPLIAFSAVRSLESWLQPLRASSALASILPTDQMYTWANAGYPLQTFLAAPDGAPTNTISRISASVQPEQRRGLLTNFLGRFVTASNFASLKVEGVPFMSAFLQATPAPSGNFLYGGLVPDMKTNRPVPPELLAQFSGISNLVYYDWEITGPRVEAWLYIGQTLRLLLGLPQLPATSPGVEWLKAVLLKTGNSVTAITVTAPSRLRFSRTSSMGLTGWELHFVADWLESPQFPFGTHTSLVPPPPGLRRPVSRPPAK